MNQAKWQAWVWIKWKPGTPSTAWEGWKSNSKIKGAWTTQGECDSCLWVDISNPDQLEDFVWKTVRKNEWVQDTKSSWSKAWWMNAA